MNSYNLCLVLVLASLFALSCSQEQGKEEHTSKIANIQNEIEPAEKPAAFETALKNVDQLPLFGGCATWECSNQKLIQYIHDNLKYPEEAKSGTVEGKVFVQFIVETDGTVSNTYIAKDIGAGCGQAAASLVKNMNDLDVKWTPGRHEDKLVNVAMTLPFSFKLE